MSNAEIFVPPRLACPVPRPRTLVTADVPGTPGHRRVPSGTPRLVLGSGNLQKMLKILELYSGIGGMQAAAQESGLPFQVVASYEINPSAMDVYCKNFPGSSKPHNILGLSLEELTRLHPDIIMMSPPCQPFTRV